MITRMPSPKHGKIHITFELPSDLWADQIHLVGDFNDWNKTAHPLVQRRRDGNWEITLELDTGREYQFRYLIDEEQWCLDNHADGYVLSPDGGRNSVVVASLPSTETAPE